MFFTSENVEKQSGSGIGAECGTATPIWERVKMVFLFLCVCVRWATTYRRKHWVLQNKNKKHTILRSWNESPIAIYAVCYVMYTLTMQHKTGHILESAGKQVSWACIGRESEREKTSVWLQRNTN